MTVWKGASARRFDLDVKVGDHVGMQADLQVDPTELLQGLVEVELPAVDLGTGLFVYGVGDVDRGDRPEQPAFGAGPGLDRDGSPFELGGERLGGFALPGVACLAVPSHRVRLLLAARGRL